MKKQIRIPITVQDNNTDGHFRQLIGAPRTAWPVRFSVSFPAGAIRGYKSYAPFSPLDFPAKLASTPENPMLPEEVVTPDAAQKAEKP